MNGSGGYHDLDHEGAALRFIDECGKDIRKVANTRSTWYVWNGEVWQEDPRGEIVFEKTRVLKRVVRREIREQSFEKGERGGMSMEEKAWRAFLGRLGDVNFRRSVLQAVEGHSAIRVDESVFDQREDLFNVGNGTLELLDDGEVYLRPYARDDYLTVRTLVNYVPGAQSPMWDSVMETFQPDPEQRAFLKRAAGYTVQGGQSEECMFINSGDGANGKSTFNDGMRAVLGDLYLEISPRTLKRSRRDGSAATPDVLDMKNKRMVTANEARVELDTEQIKRWIDNALITARGLYASNSQFTPHFTLWLASNMDPHIDDQTFAMWRRIHRIDWPVAMDINDPRRLDKTVVKKALQKEAEGILAWMVEGWKEYKAQGGLNPPISVLESTIRMRDNQDWFGSFVAECIDEGSTSYGESDFVKRSDIWRMFERWRHGDIELRRVKKRELNERLMKEWGETKLRDGHPGWVGRSFKVNISFGLD